MSKKVVKLPNVKMIGFGGLNLQLRLTGRDIVNIEKRLDKSMLSLFLSEKGGVKLPPANELLIVLQGANQTHGITDKDIIQAFETFLDEGHTTMDLQSIVQELLDEAGFFGKDKPEAKEDQEAQEELTLEAATIEESTEL